MEPVFLLEYQFKHQPSSTVQAILIINCEKLPGWSLVAEFVFCYDSRGLAG
jgi:hypothetical protein